ncbi:MAG TPA: methyltransferase domain-containing protein [candidate division Zixibacteria bacterium]|nr:methyltransferase domain-containing protein [candidate division Zixibacteria bacterium]
MAEDKQDKIEWSKGRHREALIQQRKFMWPEDSVEKLAAWFELSPGMILADIGCGLGYIGLTYFKFFGQGGEYLGIDNNETLLHEAEEISKDWAIGGTARFMKADACSLPLADESVDVAACQTLLMHLPEPERALKEMIRIVKPGGLIICFEPDNLSNMLIEGNNSFPEQPLEVKLFLRKISFLTYEGRKKLSKGDLQIGSKIPLIMSQLGLTDIGIRNCDRVGMVIPPYEGEEQQHRIKNIRQHMGREHHEEELAEMEAEFEAGGGDPEEFRRYREIVEEIRCVAREQLDRDEFWAVMPPLFYAIKGRKASSR